MDMRQWGDGYLGAEKDMVSSSMKKLTFKTVLSFVLFLFSCCLVLSHLMQLSESYPYYNSLPSRL